MGDTQQSTVSRDEITAQLPIIAEQIVSWLDASKLPSTFNRDELKSALVGWLEETGVDDILRKHDGHGDKNEIFARSFAFTHGGNSARSNVPLSSYLSSWVTRELGVSPTPIAKLERGFARN